MATDAARVRDKWHRLSMVICGLGFAAVSAAAVIVIPTNDLPGQDTSAAGVATWCADHVDRIRVGALLVGAAMMLLLAVATLAPAAPFCGACRRLLDIGAVGFAVTFGIGGCVLPAAATMHAAAPAEIRGLHDAAVAMVAFSGFFGAMIAAAGAGLLASGRRLARLFLGVSVATACGELAAPAGLLTLTGPLNPYNGAITLSAGVLFVGWFAGFAVMVRDLDPAGRNSFERTRPGSDLP